MGRNMCLNIRFTRDSTSLVDDCNNNEKEFSLPEDITWDKLIPFLKNNGFIPNVSPNDVVWVLMNDKNWEMLSYFTKFDKTLIFKDSFCKVKDFKHFHLKYYSTRFKRGEQVFIDNSCSDYMLWHDGGATELELCDVSQTEKEQWKKNYLSPS